MHRSGGPGSQPGGCISSHPNPSHHPILSIDHRPILETRKLHWDDEAACAAWAQALAARPGITQAFIALQGPLGAGKTTLVRHLLRALGVAGRIKSPSYAVLEPHLLASGTEASHFDFYRFNDPREWADAGFRDVFCRPGLKLAEWPDNAAGQLPPADLRISIEPLDPVDSGNLTGDQADQADPADPADQARQVTVQAFTPLGLALLA